VMLIAKVLSFSGGDGIYSISREGRTKASGGRGVKWGCSCPDCVIRNRTCKHQLTLFAQARTGRVDERLFKVTTSGVAVLKIKTPKGIW